MAWNNRGSLVLGISLGLLFGAAVWFRVTSLKTSPEPIGDEAFFGVQAMHLLQGEPITKRTPSGNLVNPFLIAAHVPLLAVFEPSYSVLRTPAAAAGILAVVLLFVLGKRVLDRTTALIAAGMLAVLPIAIIFSRIGWETSQLPLFGVLCFYAALRGSPIGLLLAFVGSFLVHPTTLFLAPALLLVLTVKQVQALPTDPEARPLAWRRIGATLALALVIIGSVALWKRDSPATQWVYETYNFGPCDWSRFLSLYQKHLLGFCQGVPTETTRWHDVLFWGVLPSVLVLGTVRLIRQRAWDRLALVVGWIASASGFHLVVGPDGLHPAMPRYGMFLVVPTVLAFACLTRSLLVEATTPRNAWFRTFQIAGLLVLGFALLGSVKVHYFDIFKDQNHGQERFWTLKTETKEPMGRITSILLNDMARSEATREEPFRVVAEDWWSYRPIQFLAGREPGVEVVSLEPVTDPDRRRALLLDTLKSGHYVVGQTGEELDQVVKELFPEAALRHWHVQMGVHPCYSVYRLRRAPDEHYGHCFCNGFVAFPGTDHLVR